MPSFAKGGNKRLFNNKIIGIYIFFNIFNICVLYIHCTHSEYMWGVGVGGGSLEFVG